MNDMSISKYLWDLFTKIVLIPIVPCVAYNDRKLCNFNFYCMVCKNNRSINFAGKLYHIRECVE